MENFLFCAVYTSIVLIHFVTFPPPFQGISVYCSIRNMGKKIAAISNHSTDDFLQPIFLERVINKKIHSIESHCIFVSMTPVASKGIFWIFAYLPQKIRFRKINFFAIIFLPRQTSFLNDASKIN